MSEDRIEAYAVAVYEVARAEGQLLTVEEELYSVASALEQNDALRESLTDQRIPVETRQGIVEDLLGERANPVTTNLVSFVVGAGRGHDLPAIVQKFVGISSDSRGQKMAEVRSAISLDESQSQRLAEALSSHFGHPVNVKVTVDPSIMGGLVVRMGDTVIDGSVRNRLAQLRAQV